MNTQLLPALLALLALLPLGACGGETPPAEATGSDRTADAGDSPDLAAGHHHVQCGCAIESVGVCGEFVEIDGEMVPLVLPDGNGLGAMPFCGKDGLTAAVEGDLVDGAFVATSFELDE